MKFRYLVKYITGADRVMMVGQKSLKNVLIIWFCISASLRSIPGSRIPACCHRTLFSRCGHVFRSNQLRHRISATPCGGSSRWTRWSQTRWSCFFRLFVTFKKQLVGGDSNCSAPQLLATTWCNFNVSKKAVKSVLLKYPYLTQLWS